MQVLPSELGSSVTKSMAMWDQGRWETWSRLSNPAGSLSPDLLLAQMSQAATNVWTSFLMDGHQKRCWIKARVQVVPRWKAILELCPHLNTCGQTKKGTKRWLAGLLPGPVSCSWSSRTRASILSRAAPTRHWDGRELHWKSIWLDISGSWVIWERNIKTWEKERPPGLQNGPYSCLWGINFNHK